MPVWIISCKFNFPLSRKFFEHTLQEYGFSPVWIFSWTFTFEVELKVLPQNLQAYGFSPVWILSWTINFEGEEHFRPQNLQKYGGAFFVSFELSIFALKLFLNIKTESFQFLLALALIWRIFRRIHKRIVGFLTDVNLLHFLKNLSLSHMKNFEFCSHFFVDFYPTFFTSLDIQIHRLLTKI